MFVRSMYICGASRDRVLGWMMGSRLQQMARYTNSCDSRVGIIGVPFDRGQKINTEFHGGPEAIRDGGLVKQLTTFNGR